MIRWRFYDDSNVPVPIQLLVYSAAFDSLQQTLRSEIYNQLLQVARRNSKLHFQSGQRPRARAERFDFDAEPLEHIDVQIA